MSEKKWSLIEIPENMDDKDLAMYVIGFIAALSIVLMDPLSAKEIALLSIGAIGGMARGMAKQ